MPLAIYKKKGMSKEEYKELLNHLYVNKKQSQHKIAEILNVHPTTIEAHFKEFEIKGRSKLEIAKLNVKSVTLNSRQIDILNGIILSDGCLDASNSRVSARLTLGFKYLETLEDIVSELSCLKFGPIWQCPKTKCYHIKSGSYKELKEWWNIWYEDGIKIVPKNLVLSSLTCLYWFMGDGYGVNYGFMLSTDSFKKHENELLVDKLALNNILSYVTSNNRVRVKGVSAKDFMHFIESDKKILDHYKYKFDYRRRNDKKR